jgi:hypothetical protein
MGAPICENKFCFTGEREREREREEEEPWKNEEK